MGKGKKTVSKDIHAKRKRVKFDGPYGHYSKRQLIKKLDIIFSEWVKLVERTPMGTWVCVTCGTMHTDRKQIQAGHFIPRGYYATRWDPMNVHTQCRRCNGMRAGEWLRYEVYLKDRYGAESIEHMKLRALVAGQHQLAREEIIMLIEMYSRSVEELEAREKGELKGVVPGSGDTPASKMPQI